MVALRIGRPLIAFFLTSGFLPSRSGTEKAFGIQTQLLCPRTRHHLGRSETGVVPDFWIRRWDISERNVRAKHLMICNSPSIRILLLWRPWGRLSPLCESIPKPLLPVRNRPMLFYSLDFAHKGARGRGPKPTVVSVRGQTCCEPFRDRGYSSPPPLGGGGVSSSQLPAACHRFCIYMVAQPAQNFFFLAARGPPGVITIGPGCGTADTFRRGSGSDERFRSIVSSPCDRQVGCSQLPEEGRVSGPGTPSTRHGPGNGSQSVIIATRLLFSYFHQLSFSAFILCRIKLLGIIVIILQLLAVSKILPPVYKDPTRFPIVIHLCVQLPNCVRYAMFHLIYDIFI